MTFPPPSTAVKVVITVVVAISTEVRDASWLHKKLRIAPKCNIRCICVSKASVTLSEASKIRLSALKKENRAADFCFLGFDMSYTENKDSFINFVFTYTKDGFETALVG